MRAAAVTHLIGDLIKVQLPVLHEFFNSLNFLLDNELFYRNIFVFRKQAAQVGVVFEKLC